MYARERGFHVYLCIMYDQHIPAFLIKRKKIISLLYNLSSFQNTGSCELLHTRNNIYIYIKSVCRWASEVWLLCANDDCDIHVGNGRARGCLLLTGDEVSTLWWKSNVMQTRRHLGSVESGNGGKLRKNGGKKSPIQLTPTSALKRRMLSKMAFKNFSLPPPPLSTFSLVSFLRLCRSPLLTLSLFLFQCCFPYSSS